jgi:hypothetical protein
VASFPYPVPGYPMGIFATTNDDESVVMVSWEEIFTEIQINKTLPKAVSSNAEEIPIDYSLSQNYPNPFNPSTTIKYSVPEPGIVQLKVYDIIGNEVAVLVNEKKAPGSYNAGFNAARLASGVYIYTLRAGSFVETKKMILMK